MFTHRGRASGDGSSGERSSSAGRLVAAILTGAALMLTAAACESAEGARGSNGDESAAETDDESSTDEVDESAKNTGVRRMDEAPEGLKRATFAGGCFWCMEPPFEKLDGVKAVVSGYTGGEAKHPTYKQVSSGNTDHAEAVRIHYDPEVVSYEKLLRVFWQNIDPTAEGRQFVDVGSQYRTAIFYHSERQKKLAEESKEELAKNGPFDEQIVTPIQEASAFWRAENYHQDFYKKSPGRYKSYRNGSGRDAFIEKHWSDLDPDDVWGELSDGNE
ncbi:MAG: peptide-methionine (S)-S-oxide reductase MsrA [Bradymonadaceae bacterium]